MGEFFKPLRRKIGVLSLSLACAMMIGWFRSYLVADQFVNYEDECATVEIAGGCVAWSRPTTQLLDGISTPCFGRQTGWDWYSESFTKEPMQLGADFQYLTRFKHLGVEVATAVRERTSPLWLVETVEYWKVSLLNAVIPLTLISAWFLFGTLPRKRVGFANGE